MNWNSFGWNVRRQDISRKFLEGVRKITKILCGWPVSRPEIEPWSSCSQVWSLTAKPSHLAVICEHVRTFPYVMLLLAKHSPRLQLSPHAVHPRRILGDSRSTNDGLFKARGYHDAEWWHVTTSVADSEIAANAPTGCFKITCVINNFIQKKSKAIPVTGLEGL
jgi:hypothetical protein